MLWSSTSREMQCMSTNQPHDGSQVPWRVRLAPQFRDTCDRSRLDYPHATQRQASQSVDGSRSRNGERLMAPYQPMPGLDLQQSRAMRRVCDLLQAFQCLWRPGDSGPRVSEGVQVHQCQVDHHSTIVHSECLERSRSLRPVEGLREAPKHPSVHTIQTSREAPSTLA